jgi:hypothetical protein
MRQDFALSSLAGGIFGGAQALLRSSGDENTYLRHVSLSTMPRMIFLRGEAVGCVSCASTCDACEQEAHEGKAIHATRVKRTRP